MLLIVGLIFLAICFLLLVLLSYCLEKNIIYKDLKGKHVVITGGSSGIGKGAALEVAKLGADITIIGRDLQKLQNAVKEISAHCKSQQKIQYVALDITCDYGTISDRLAALEKDVGPVFMLVNCAGMCICGQFEEMKIEHVNQMINLNYFGTAYPTRYVLPGMKERNDGLIVFVSTEAALLGIYGYSAYSAAKWAVRGLAETLFMELAGTNVTLTLAFPPDTDTPGFQNEELTKPKETKLISSSAGLHSPEDVGKKMIHDALSRKKYSAFGLSGHLMSILLCSSVESVGQVLLQVFCSGILRIILVSIILSFYKIVRDGLKGKFDKQKKT